MAGDHFYTTSDNQRSYAVSVGIGLRETPALFSVHKHPKRRLCIGCTIRGGETISIR